jgi:hypothetical protein
MAISGLAYFMDITSFRFLVNIGTCDSVVVTYSLLSFVGYCADKEIRSQEDWRLDPPGLCFTRLPRMQGLLRAAGSHCPRPIGS